MTTATEGEAAVQLAVVWHLIGHSAAFLQEGTDGYLAVRPIGREKKFGHVSVWCSAWCCTILLAPCLIVCFCGKQKEQIG